MSDPSLPAFVARLRGSWKQTPEQRAIHQMFNGYQKLKALGWRDTIYCPKDGSHFLSIEPGSTGIHDTNYEGEWPDGSWWIFDGDIWPARPCLFKPKEPK